MKRCPQCQRLETDDTLVFCRNDGTRLVPETGSAEFQTRNLSESTAAEADSTRLLPRNTGESPHATVASSRSLQSPALSARLQTPLGKFSRRKVGIIIAVVAAVVILPIAIVVVASLVAYRHARNTEVAIESIAVLPFENTAGDPNTDYLTDGLTESIINSLTQLPNLKVIARSSVFRYKGKVADPITAGKELGVRAVLTGRLTQMGDDVIVSAELVDLRDNKQIWGEKYQRKIADLLAVERDIAREITSNLRPKLSGEEQNRAAKNYTDNAAAYEAYLKGRFYWNKRTPADFHKAIEFFQQAIEKDPNYALAYSGLADSYALLSVYGGGSPIEWMPLAKAAAQKSLALDDNLAEGHASLGQILSYYDFDLNRAEEELQRAITLNPNYATAHQWRAENLSALGRVDEALVEARRALELDPLSLIINRNYGDCLVDARRFDEAIEQYQKTIALDPNFPTAHFFLGRAYEAKGMYDEAVTEYMKSANTSGQRAEDLTRMREAYAKGGWTAYLQTSLNILLGERRGYVPPYVVASIYARLGKKDEAFAYLEKGLRERDFRTTLVKVSFEFDSLRSDPRYADFIKRVAVP
jgi:TolB-like protein/Tfp pilus assembly protein PilF